jgi:hypothetical protein
MKKESMDQIEKVYYKKIADSVKCIQKNVKMFLTRSRYRNLLKLKKLIRQRNRISKIFKTEYQVIIETKMKNQFRNLEKLIVMKRMDMVSKSYQRTKSHFHHLKQMEREKSMQLKKKKMVNCFSKSDEDLNYPMEEIETNEQLTLLKDLEELLEKKEQELVQKDSVISEKDLKIQKLEQQIKMLETRKTESKLEINRKLRESKDENLSIPNANNKQPMMIESIQNLTNHDLSLTIEQLQMEKDLQGEVFSNLLTILKLKTLENKLVYKFFYSNDHKLKGVIAENLGKLKGDEKILKKKLSEKLEELNKMGNENYIERFSYLRSSIIRGSNVSFQRPRN